MGRAWLVLMLLACSSTAFADTRFELDGGLAADHLSGGQCDSGNGFVGACGGHMAVALDLEAGEVLGPDRLVVPVARETIGFARSIEHGWLARASLGVGARLQPSPGGYVELTIGQDFQLGDTGTGESGIASGSNFSTAFRFGALSGPWAFVLEAFLVPGAFDQVGMADFGLCALASRAFGD